MKLIQKKWVVLMLIAILLIGCQKQNNHEDSRSSEKTASPTKHTEHPNIYYEIFVRSFADSNGDRIGDLNGVISKLDYLKDLGVEGIWLTPIMTSPSYHGYDVIDYEKVNSDFGTFENVKKLVNEAHKRNIHVIIDLVLNHTSREHPWFQKALAGDPIYRNYYVWANQETNLGQLGDYGQQIWHGNDENIYEGVFSEAMPDLNYDNPEVRSEMIRVGKFWLEKAGVDGFRLDAAKFIYSSYQASNNHGKNADFWKEFHAEMKKVNQNVFLVGEIWASPGVIGPYLKGLNSGFNFELSEKIIKTVKFEQDAGIVNRLIGIREFYQNNNKSYIDSTFLSNHDTNRIMSEVNGDIDKAKMAASLLMTLPGTPFLYYGEEIGLEGIKPDEYIREPFIWDMNEDPSQTKWIDAKYNVNRADKSLSVQMKNNASLFYHYKNLIHARKDSKPLKQGDIEAVSYNQAGLIAFKRTTEKEEVLVIHNVSKKEITVKNVEKMNNIYYSSYENEDVKDTIVLPAYSTLILQK
ncbi:alpha-amylase family glycosyl hydrolase [Bacillus sp. 03113]|uniref:alpha-amylase family glycosyl hydrolase n=1 Tax=Bacillus sp. 03113 TaxID=2578211 RepID=UPI0011445843|nr:alpha-amylase family glycosyl hydrolase [Bacillus sp. 03113]